MILLKVKKKYWPTKYSVYGLEEIRYNYQDIYYYQKVLIIKIFNISEIITEVSSQKK